MTCVICFVPDLYYYVYIVIKVVITHLSDVLSETNKSETAPVVCRQLFISVGEQTELTERWSGGLRVGLSSFSKLVSHIPTK